MPIGAVIGGAVIAGGATVAAGAMGADAQSDAAQTAADSSYAVAQINNDLYRDIYNQNLGVLAPYAAGGLPSMYLMNDLLGVTGYGPPPPAALMPPGSGTATGGQTGSGTTAPVSGGASGGGALNGYVPGSGASVGGGALQAAIGSRPMGALRASGEPMGMTGYGPGTIQSANGTSVARPRLANFRGNAAGYRDAVTAWRAGQTAPTASTGGGAGTGAGALSPWDTFRNSTNYQFRLNEGTNALKSKQAALGMYESGAADKALVKFSQDYAANELSNYMNLLAGQQAMGLSAAGAVAGVGTSYAGNVAAQNTNAGNAAANAALMAGQGQANIWGSIGQAGGQLGGALYQYGMGKMMPQAQYAPAGSAPIVVNPTNAGQSYWTNGGW